MEWNAETIARVATAYRRYYALAQGSRAERLEAEKGDWAYGQVTDACGDGTLPVEVLDAMLTDPDGDADYRAYVAAGPVEDLLTDHLPSYADAFTDRSRRHRVWAEALTHVWLDRDVWEQLPEQLRRLVPERAAHNEGDHEKSRPLRARKRQSRRPRE